VRRALPTGAWDMQKFLLDLTHAGHGLPHAPEEKRLNPMVKRIESVNAFVVKFPM